MSISLRLISSGVSTIHKFVDRAFVVKDKVTEEYKRYNNVIEEDNGKGANTQYDKVKLNNMIGNLSVNTLTLLRRILDLVRHLLMIILPLVLVVDILIFIVVIASSGGYLLLLEDYSTIYSGVHSDVNNTESSESSNFVVSGDFGEQLIAEAKKYVPGLYVYGGVKMLDLDTGVIGGSDCSAFICNLYMQFGYDLWVKRTCMRELTEYGAEVIDSIDNAKAGDILKYDCHVALYDGNGGTVQAMDDANGIVTTDYVSGGYTHIIRIFGTKYPKSDKTPEELAKSNGSGIVFWDYIDDLRKKQG